MSDLKIPPRPQDHHQGDLNAPLILVEYGDYQCPYCARAHEVVKAVQKEFGDRLCFIFRQFPLREIHPFAEGAAEMAEAAASQGLFWPMHGMLFENQDALDENSLVLYAAQVGVDRATVAEALEGRFAAKVDDDIESGIASGVDGTPSFFCNGRRYPGQTDADELIEFLEEVLAYR